MVPLIMATYPVNPPPQKNKKQALVCRQLWLLEERGQKQRTENWLVIKGLIADPILDAS